jgi:hypothetical protein
VSEAQDMSNSLNHGPSILCLIVEHVVEWAMTEHRGIRGARSLVSSVRLNSIRFRFE